MNACRLAMLVVACSCAAASCQSAWAAAPPPGDRSPAGLQAGAIDLLERLEAAEQRIGQLEANRPLPIEAAFGSAAAEPGFEEDAGLATKDRGSTDAEADSGPTAVIDGRLHLDYWAFPNESPGANAFETGDSASGPFDRFLCRRARLAVSGDLPASMVYRIDLDFARPNALLIKDLWIGWSDLPFLGQLLVGNQRRPYFLDCQNNSNFIPFLERSLAADALNTDLRRFGACSYGVSEDMAYNWRFGVFNLDSVQATGEVRSDHYQPELAGRFANTIWYDENGDGRVYGHWAVSGSWADTDVERRNGTRRFSTRPEARTDKRWLDTGEIPGLESYGLLGWESVLNFGPLQVGGEYVHNFCHRSDAYRDLQFDGGYVYLSYLLTGEHVPWNRESGTIDSIEPFRDFVRTRSCREASERGWGAWQVAVRCSQCDLTDEDVLGGVGRNLTGALNWHWSSHARMQFNYTYGKITDHEPVDGYSQGDYHLFGTRFSVDF